MGGRAGAAVCPGAAAPLNPLRVMNATAHAKPRRFGPIQPSTLGVKPNGENRPVRTEPLQTLASVVS